MWKCRMEFRVYTISSEMFYSFLYNSATKHYILNMLLENIIFQNKQGQNHNNILKSTVHIVLKKI